MTDLALSARRRRRANMAIFLGPAVLLLALFFLLPVLLNIGLAFTDMGRNLKVTGLTLHNFERMLTGDRLLGHVLATTLIYVVGTLLIFNTGFALVLAVTTTSLPPKGGAFFRAIWLLPRMSPSVVYALLWKWAISPTPSGLINQFLGLVGLPRLDLMNQAPLVLIIVLNGFIGASLGMIILTSAIRAIPEHLFHAARVDGAGGLSVIRHVVLPAIRWPLSFITVFQTLALLVSFEYIWLVTDGGPFYDTTVYALYVYKRAFGNGEYAYGAALALGLVLIGIVSSLALWRFMDMRSLLQRPRIEVQ